jgi:hypothetical protein
MSRTGTSLQASSASFHLETTSMFKKLVPVIALALIAGPVLAADPPASDTSAPAASSTTKSHKSHSKHHSSSKKHKSSSTDAAKSDTSNAPAK